MGKQNAVWDRLPVYPSTEIVKKMLNSDTIFTRAKYIDAIK